MSFHHASFDDTVRPLWPSLVTRLFFRLLPFSLLVLPHNMAENANCAETWEAGNVAGPRRGTPAATLRKKCCVEGDSAGLCSTADSLGLFFFSAYLHRDANRSVSFCDLRRRNNSPDLMKAVGSCAICIRIATQAPVYFFSGCCKFWKRSLLLGQSSSACICCAFCGASLE